MGAVEDLAGLAWHQALAVHIGMVLGVVVGQPIPLFILLDVRMVAYQDGKAAGCGAWKKKDDQTAEIKRIFVSKDFPTY